LRHEKTKHSVDRFCRYYGSVVRLCVAPNRNFVNHDHYFSTNRRDSTGGNANDDYDQFNERLPLKRRMRILRMRAVSSKQNRFHRQDADATGIIESTKSQVPNPRESSKFPKTKMRMRAMTLEI
jgi:hypothetical protein